VIELMELETYCNELLDSTAVEDYCPNGLQVDSGGGVVRRLVSGVTASQALIDAAVERGADLVLVHHGYFWKGESQVLTGIKGRRIRALINNGISLMAYHLPLDRHPELGNNRMLAHRLGVEDARPMDEREGLLWRALLPRAETPQAFIQRLTTATDRPPLHLEGGGEQIERIAWCTGAAQGYIERAAEAGMQAFVSGEVSEQTCHLARELGIHYFAAGHHATERYGVQALGGHLAERFGLEHHFIDIPNPV
jgi:dinuclear metal center YbgI/SA1388 family protein